MATAAHFAQPVGIGDVLKKSQENMKVIAGLGLSDNLRRSWEHTSLLAHEVDQALSNIRVPVPPPIEVPNLDMEWVADRRNDFIAEIPPNPIFETNRQLTELTGTVTQLIEVTQKQAELTQAIRETSSLALQHAMASGEDAKSATRLARTSVLLALGAILVAVVASIYTIYDNHQLSTATDGRLQEEIRVLREISGHLKESTRKPPDNPALNPKLHTVPRK